MKIEGKIEEGKIVVSQGILAEMGLEEGDSFIFQCEMKKKKTSEKKTKTLFGAMKEQTLIKGDITSPIDVEWDAMR